jgi:hypothetical protein
LWPGERCVIIGGGPSIKQFDFGLLNGHRVIATNNAFRHVRGDVLFYGDCKWYNRDPWRQEVNAWPGLRVHSCNANEGAGPVKKIKRWNRVAGLCKDPSKIAWGINGQYGNTGASAINLAVHFGVKQIILIGYDMRLIDGDSNYHRDHPHHEASRQPDKKPEPAYNPYPNFLKVFPAIANSLRRWNIDCINATPESALECFPIMTPEEALC